MANQSKVQVTPADFKSLGLKLAQLRASLSKGESNVFDFLLGTLGRGAGQIPPHKWFHVSKSIGVGHNVPMLVAGGSDGLTILVYKNGHIVVIPPEGPLPPIDGLANDVAAAIPIQGT